MKVETVGLLVKGPTICAAWRYRLAVWGFDNQRVEHGLHTGRKTNLGARLGPTGGLVLSTEASEPVRPRPVEDDAPEPLVIGPTVRSTLGNRLVRSPIGDTLIELCQLMEFVGDLGLPLYSKSYCIKEPFVKKRTSTSYYIIMRRFDA